MIYFFILLKEFGNGIQAGDSSLYINGIEISIEELNAFKYVFFVFFTIHIDLGFKFINHNTIRIYKKYKIC